MRSRFLVFLLAAIFVASSAASALAADGTWTEAKVSYDGYEREYATYIPASWKRGGSVMVFFHGFTLGFKDYRKGTGMLEAADKHSIALLMPNGLPLKVKSAPWLLNPRVWDMGQVQDRNEFVDDAGFVSWLISDFIAQNGADSGRVLIGGHSNGAFFAHYLVGLNPGRFAGLASIMGRYYKLTVPRAIPPIPTLIINGLQDPVLPIEGKDGTAPQQSVPAAQENIEYWASIMGLEASASRSELKEGGYRLKYKDALGKAMLVADYVDKQGHWIPGARPSAFQSFFGGSINMSYKGFDMAFGMLLGAVGTGFGN